MPYRAVQLLRLLSMLWNYALDLDEDIVARNPFQRLDLPARPSRSQVWQPGQIERFIQTALTPGPWGRTRGGRPDRPHGPRPSVALAVIIGINTAQRPSDVLALNWSQYDGRYITLTQIKTRATVTIPVTDALKIALDDAKRARTEGTVVAFAADGPIVLSETSGQRYEASRFAAIFRMIKAAAGIPRDLEYRDLRRTATTHLAEAGCSTHQIASIGGWSIDTVARMMSVYGKVNVTIAESAILKLEQYRKRPLEG
jgi:integrase